MELLLPFGTIHSEAGKGAGETVSLAGLAGAGADEAKGTKLGTLEGLVDRF